MLLSHAQCLQGFALATFLESPTNGCIQLHRLQFRTSLQCSRADPLRFHFEYGTALPSARSTIIYRSNHSNVHVSDVLVLF